MTTREGGITLSMITRNEARRYLVRALDAALPHVQHLSVIDDGSTDDTPYLIVQAARAHGVPLTLECRRESGFHEEHRLRRDQWVQAARTGASWVLTLDADEELITDGLAPQAGIGGCFRLYDMWSATQYRDDRYWTAHHRWWPMLMPVLPGDPARFPARNQHCGRAPESTHMATPGYVPMGSILHWGWSRHVDRAAKARRYADLDPDGKLGDPAQYASILDPDPHLVEFRR